MIVPSLLKVPILARLKCILEILYSCCAYLSKTEMHPRDTLFMLVWKLDVLECVKLFIWLVVHERFLTSLQ